jgi:tRNA(Arg) A34 adenosine deaminase TadA
VNIPKLLQLARSVTSNLEHHWKHVSFILDGKHVVSVGWNQPFKTHPLAYKWRYRYNAIHSELHAIISFDGSIPALRKLSLVNIRIDRKGNPALAAPCNVCCSLLEAFRFKEVWYTDRQGKFALYS